VSEIDWSKVDTDYTHYSKEYGYFVREIKHTNAWACKDGPVLVFLDPGKQLIARPSAWNGTGLPPVGTVCEMHHECWQPANWPEVAIKYASDEYFITQDSAGEQHWHARGVQFRPIRTPEQIAADEREAAIDEIMDDLSLSPECRYIAKRVLSTGYRKP
jgi:hypothetical protein